MDRSVYIINVSTGTLFPIPKQCVTMYG
uniref:Uncharacterized protein n=1 Tax=Anguilla anguilla TaxID=7936 RepID=A0A0E9UI54_ANGAN